MAVVTMKQLLEAGVHFGHQTRRWNPKMRRFIFGERNGIYIVDLHQTLDRIDTAYRFVREHGRRRRHACCSSAPRSRRRSRSSSRPTACGMPYVNFRWLGGMLTNFQTVHARVAKLRELQRQVDSGEVDQMIKKEGLKVRRELAKLERNLGGIKNLEKLPSVIFVIDTKKEHIAVTEANRLRHPGGRGRRHQLRPRRHRLRDPRQRRRDPLGEPHVPRDRRRGRRRSRTLAQQAQGARPGDASAEAAAPEAARTPEEKREFQETQQAEARTLRPRQQAAREARVPRRRPRRPPRPLPPTRRDAAPTSRPQPTGAPKPPRPPTKRRRPRPPRPSRK